MATCGYTWEYVHWEMTLPKLAALVSYWKVTPPMQTMIACIATALGCDWQAAAKAEAAGAAAALSAAKAEAAKFNAGEGRG